MRTDITDKLTPELRDGWRNLFDGKAALEDAIETLIKGLAIQTRKLRTQEKNLWRDLRAVLPVSLDSMIGVDESGKIFLTEPGYADAKGAPNELE